MKDSGLKEAATAATFSRQNDLALLIHQSFQPRLGINGKYAYFRKDDGTRVTWDRSEYVVAQRDIIKALRPKVMTKLKLPDAPEKARVHRTASFPLGQDDRAVAKYCEVCARLNARRAPSVVARQREIAQVRGTTNAYINA